ncbi:MAG: TRAP transporter small permease [Eubacteriales bacterium]|nr:TRAP transporter small permease [Eubacteriales bacterium]
MDTIKRINKGVRKVEEFLIAYSIILMAIVLFFNVIGRLVLHRSLIWAEEICTIFTIFCTFTGVSYCARMGRHISMSAIFDAVSQKTKKVMMCIVSFVTALVLFFVSYIALRYVIFLFGSGRVTASLHLPLWAMYIVIPVFLAIGGIQYLLILYMNLHSNTVMTSIDKIDETYIEDATDKVPEILEEDMIELEGEDDK